MAHPGQEFTLGAVSCLSPLQAALHPGCPDPGSGSCHYQNHHCQENTCRHRYKHHRIGIHQFHHRSRSGPYGYHILVSQSRLLLTAQAVDRLIQYRKQFTVNRSGNSKTDIISVINQGIGNHIGIVVGLHIVLDFGGDSVKKVHIPIVHRPQCRPDIRKVSDLIRLYPLWHAPSFNDRSHQTIRGIADPLIPDDNVAHGCICL